MTIRTRLIGLRSSGSVGGSGSGRGSGEGKGKARGVVGSVSASMVSMASEEQRSDGRVRFLDLLLRSWTPLSAAVTAVTAVQLALRLGKWGSIGDNGYECTCSGRGETSIRAVDMMLVVVVVGAR